MDLKNKVAIVTGAAHGIGEACAREFSRHGAEVVVSDIDSEAAQKTAAAISRETGQRTHAIKCDVSDDGACQSLLSETVQEFGRCDILVNNAGIIKTGTVLDLDPDDFDKVLRINLRSCFVLTQLVAKQMVEKKIAGSIINMSSLNSVLAIPNQIAYVTSKGGLQQLTKASALGLAEYNIRVNAIGPGSIMTDILKVVMNDEAARRNILARTPLRRVGEPDEIGKVAVFLASDYASYITGQTIFPDGGRSALNYTVPVDEPSGE